MRVNPAAIFLVAFTTVIGFIVGSPLIGLAMGLGLVLVATILD